VKTGEIIAVGITAQSTSIVCLDSKGKPVRPAILYMDSRAEDIGAEISRGRALGYTPLKYFSNLEWMKRFESRKLERTKMVLDAKEFIAYKLTGVHTHDSRALPRNILEELSSELGFPLEWFGGEHGYFSPVGEVTSWAEEETGIAEGTPVVVGPWDGFCNIIGSGLIKPGIAMDVAGTTEIISVALKEKVPAAYIPHLIDGLWLAYKSPPLGIAHKWFLIRLMSSEKKFAEESGLDPYDLLSALAQKAPAGCNGLICVPTLKGEFGKKHLRGGFIGVSIAHGKEYLARALLEGIAFHVRMVFEELEALGAEIEKVRLSGGGAKSKFWSQIRADVTGKTFEVVEAIETGCLGAAMLALIATGKYRDLVSATEEMVRISRVYKPDPERHKKYSDLYKKYRRAYEFLDKLYEAHVISD